MELQLEQQVIPCLIPCAHRSAEEHFSADFVVPDSMPDVSALLLTEGDLCLWRLDLNDGSAEMEGEISARICYGNDHGAPLSFPVRIPVRSRLRAEAFETGQRPFLRCRMKSLTTHLLNSRKVRVQGTLLCSLVTYGSSEIAVTTGMDSNEKHIYIQKSKLKLPYISAVEEQVFSAEETLALLRGVPADGKLLSYASIPVIDSSECGDNRVILKGSVRTTLLYQDAESRELMTETVETPFSCLTDAEADASQCRISLHLTSEEVRCRNDDPAVDTAFHLVVQLVCYSECEIECVTDAYSNQAALSMEWKEQSFPEYSRSEPERQFAEEEIEGDFGAKNICAVRAVCRSEVIQVTALFYDSEHRLSSMTFGLKTENNGDTATFAEQPTLQSAPTGFKARVPIILEQEAERVRAVRILTAANLAEEQNPVISGIALVRRAEEMDYWQLAKENTSSVDAIEAANPDCEAPPKWVVIPHVN